LAGSATPDVDQRGALVFAHPEISDTEAEET
jgi:hypothetical protein